MLDKATQKKNWPQIMAWWHFKLNFSRPAGKLSQSHAMDKKHRLQSIRTIRLQVGKSWIQSDTE
jgi:hypothetical protein